MLIFISLINQYIIDAFKESKRVLTDHSILTPIRNKSRENSVHATLAGMIHNVLITASNDCSSSHTKRYVPLAWVLCVKYYTFFCLSVGVVL